MMETIKLTRAEKFAQKKKQDRKMYVAFAREKRGFGEDQPAVKDFKFTRTGAHVFFSDGSIERMGKIVFLLKWVYINILKKN